ncbi:hypothetical protein PM082_023628 [Marasmius tenuissimus]|nr:hypothetical protein PM082_023628 [Marasmius tenuissimus]
MSSNQWNGCASLQIEVFGTKRGVELNPLWLSGGLPTFFKVPLFTANSSVWMQLQRAWLKYHHRGGFRSSAHITWNRQQNQVS